ncbi:hypothetical protein JHK86_010412 [Glycine max]|nr:hypothetical protein JHK86_010412 [Glycine max]
MKGMFRGSVPRITWYIPASALTFMAVEFLRDHFYERVPNDNLEDVGRLSVDHKSAGATESRALSGVIQPISYA